MAAKITEWERALDRLPKSGTFSEAEAIAKVDPKKDWRYQNTVVNGTHPLVATLVDFGFLRWAHWHQNPELRVLERVPPDELRPKRPPCRTVYLPPAKPEPWKAELVSLRQELGLGKPAPQPKARTNTAPLVRNASRFPINCRLLNHDFAPGEIVETDEETAAEVTRTGVFDRPSPEELARLLAAR